MSRIHSRDGCPHEDRAPYGEQCSVCHPRKPKADIADVHDKLGARSETNWPEILRANWPNVPVGRGRNISAADKRQCRELASLCIDLAAFSLKNRSVPTAQRVGVTAPPDMAFFDVYNYLTAG